MRIEVLSIDSAIPPRVYFRSAIGEAWGYWLDALPTPQQTYNVEVSVDAELEWGKDICTDESNASQLKADESGIVLIARLEGLEPDGVAFLRLDSSIVMVETYGDDVPPLGSMVRVQADSISLADTRI